MPPLAAAILVFLGSALGAAGLVIAFMGWRWRATKLRCEAAERRAEAAEAELAAAPFGHLVFDAAGLLASPALREALDLPWRLDDMTSLTARLEAEDGHRLAAHITQLRASDTPFTLTVRRADGERWFQASGCDVAGRSTVWFAEVTESETARVNAEAEAARLRGIYDVLPLPLWWRDASLRVVGANRAYSDMVGASPDQVARQGIELLDRHLRNAGRQLAACAQADAMPTSARYHVVAHGRRSLMELCEVPFGSEDNLLGLAIDRTREEEMEGEVSRLKAAHAEVLESLSTAIAILSPDLRVQFYNRAYSELWGLDGEFLDQAPHFADVLEALRDRRALPEQANFPLFKREAVNRLRNLVQVDEELMHRPDGSTLKVTLVPHPFGGVVLTYEDVTDRLTLERGFNTLIDVQRATLENLHEAVAVYGADGRLKLFNRTFCALWRLDPERLDDEPHVREVLEMSRASVAPEAGDWPSARETLVSRMIEPEAAGGRMTLPDETVLDWAQVPLPDGQTLFTYLDVTDSSRVERALRERAEALETADQLKSEFIANISYELRTPLNAIAGFAEMLEKQFFGPLNDRQRDYARSIVDSSQRLTTLINDILDLATIEAGYMELDQEDIQVAALLENLRSIAHERARNRGLTLEVACPDSLLTLRGDLRRIKQALYNLLSNAFNFTPSGGRVTLRAERIGDEVQLAVEDTGVGIPEEDRERVFEKFVRGQPRNAGAGLGLALVSRLIELHGGRVELDSPPEGGTRVACILPRASGQGCAHLPAAAPQRISSVA